MTQAIGYGGLMAVWLWAAATPGQVPARLPPLSSRAFDIEYQVNRGALPLERVELWYTLNAGAAWHKYGVDEDARSPARFVAPQEGAYGFFVVARNSAGVSSDAPSPGTLPRQWAFVDCTPPVVQLHPVRVGCPGNPRALQLKWTAIDANLPTRPVELAFRPLPDGAWQGIARQLSNTGRHDWRVPDGLTGRIMIRVSVCDLGGNRVEAVSGAVDLAAAFGAATGTPATTRPAVAQGATLTPAERARARQLCDKGLWHEGRGEYELAISRLRDALKADPLLTDALVGLGRSLYSAHRVDAAIEAYDLALSQKADSPEVLAGIAEAYVAAGRQDRAAEMLLTLLQTHPEDVEAWLQLGDVQMRRGDEMGAEESYRKAASLNPDARDAVARAQRRLAELERIRERFGRLAELEKDAERR